MDIGTQHCYRQNRISALVSHVVCSDHFALVFVQCPPPSPCLCFESRGEGAGGDIPLQNSESLSAVHILNPLSQCYINIRAVTINQLPIRFVSRFLAHGSIHPTIFFNLKSILFKQHLYNNKLNVTFNKKMFGILIRFEPKEYY
jgi:hypothetical protein